MSSYFVRDGKTLHVPGFRDIKSGKPVPDAVVDVLRSLGNLTGLLSAGYIAVADSASDDPSVVVADQPKRGPGRPKFSQVTDFVAAEKLAADSEDAI